MKKRLAIITICMVLVFSLAGCCFSHEWVDADCETPKTCSKCEKTDGEPLGHTWIDATCTSFKTCSVCGAQEGDYAEHTWIDATCSAPKTCSVCNVTDGEMIPHTWIDATCTVPKTCSVCSVTEGEPAEHPYEWTVTQEAGYGKKGSQDGVCSVCGTTTTAEIEELVPTYEWGVPITLELPLATVEVCIDTDGNEYWIDFRCEQMSSEDLSIFMVHSTSDWGINTRYICERLSKVLTMFDDFWQEEALACCSMEGYGRKWTVKMNMDEDANAYIQLKVNMLNEFNAVTGLELAE